MNPLCLLHSAAWEVSRRPATVLLLVGDADGKLKLQISTNWQT